MMKITLHNAGKRFNREWIFRGMEVEFLPGEKYAILGPNGSGKSTLIKSLSAYQRLSEGSILFSLNDRKIEEDAIAAHLSMAAPYMELIEELTVMEHLQFQEKFKPYRDGLDAEACLHYLGFEKHHDKAVKSLSSGMKQRLKLILAVGSEGSLLLLDEPATNLDAQGVKWFHHLLGHFLGQRTLVIASNREDEYEMCNHYLQIEDYKKRTS